jgi:hypothetical protein
MRVFMLAVVMLFARPVFGGPYGGFSLGGPSPGPDCSKLTPVDEEFPDWSRLQWSLQIGGAWTLHTDRVVRASAFAIVPRLSWQLWGREGQCEGGGGFLGGHAWRRLSLAYSLDVVWRVIRANAEMTDGRPEREPYDVRPGLRLARATYDTGFLTVGSSYVPSTEIAMTIGPTFDPRFSGAAISASVTAAILTVELRVAARTEGRGQEVMLLFGIADVHGLWKLGPTREYRYKSK